MQKIIYTLSFLAFVLLLTSVLHSYKNNTLVLPPEDKELNLPDQLYDYSVEFPPNVIEFLMGWGVVDTSHVSNITNEKATLGRVLFYDDRLSGDNSLSCGSCHKQELSFADDVAFSDGIGDNITTSNSMGLNDLGWQLSNRFFWDFRSHGLEDAVLQPILATHELGKDMPTLIAKLEAAEEYGPLFEDAYGDDEINEDKIARALASFIVSMSSFESKYDEGFNNDFSNFTSSEMNGLSLFEGACGFCHVAPHFGSVEPIDFFIFGNNGLDSFPDMGMGEWTNDPSLIGLFKSPSIRNIEVSAPYMHDGRFATLEEVVDFYSEGIQFNENSAFNWMFGPDFTGYDFADEQKEDLINFMKTLTDYTLLTDDRWSDPWTTITSIEPEILLDINVYPNPVADQVIVQFDNPDGATYDISVFDLTGKLVNYFKTSDSGLTIPRNDTPAGVYELVVSNSESQRTFKLVYR